MEHVLVLLLSSKGVGEIALGVNYVGSVLVELHFSNVELIWRRV